MALQPIAYSHVLGLQVQGDLGPMTCYTQHRNGRRSVVIFAKIWLSDPTSTRQLNHRNRIRAAAAAWQRLPRTEKDNWLQAAKRLSLRTNGYAVWVYFHLTEDRRSIETIERQSHITLITGLH